MTMLDTVEFQEVTFGLEIAEWRTEWWEEVRRSEGRRFCREHLLRQHRARYFSLLPGVVESQSTFVPAFLTGGSESSSGGFKIHTFTSSGTLTYTGGGDAITVQYLVVAGGGSGGGADAGPSGNSGGGGAGGFQCSDDDGTLDITATQTITRGAGGQRYTNSPGLNMPKNGANSSIGALVTAIGGGYGSMSDTYTTPQVGGSGGGYHRNVDTHPGVSGTAGQGNAGGGGAGCGTSGCGGGGGGGAGAGGQKGTTVAGTGGDGGVGRQWPSGSGTYYAGGGGGARNSGAGDGGTGGGGAGGTDGVQGTSGAANTGGGGGGGPFNAQAGSGGSGIIIIRYPL